MHITLKVQYSTPDILRAVACMRICMYACMREFVDSFEDQGTTPQIPDRVSPV